MLDAPHSTSVLHRQAGEQDSQSADTSLFGLRSLSLCRSCLARLVAMVLMWSIRCDTAYRNDITHMTLVNGLSVCPPDLLQTVQGLVLCRLSLLAQCTHALANYIHLSRHTL